MFSPGSHGSHGSQYVQGFSKIPLPHTRGVFDEV